MSVAIPKFLHEEEETDHGTPLRYVPIEDIYSTTVRIPPSNVMSKKVKARKLDLECDRPKKPSLPPPPLHHVYHRRAKRPRHSPLNPAPFFDRLLSVAPPDDAASPPPHLQLHDSGPGKGVGKKAPKYELLNLGVDSAFASVDGHRLRQNSGGAKVEPEQRRCKHHSDKCSSESSDSVKQWLTLNLSDADPQVLIGMSCKVHWTLDAAWYLGSVAGYNSETCKHHIKYADGEEENLHLSREKIKFLISLEEMQQLRLRRGSLNAVKKNVDYNEMLALAAGFDDCQNLEVGDIIWAKLTGHAMWPAVVISESLVRAKKVLKLGDRSVPVQFFGTHDFAWINIKQSVSFVGGLLSSFHLKCKQTRFDQSLEEAKIYLREQKLPLKMLRIQNGIESDEAESEDGDDEERSNSSEDDTEEEGKQKWTATCPFNIGTLRVISLGKIVRDSEYFCDRRYIWPEGYTAIREYTSTVDPSTTTYYRMEVLRDPQSTAWPLFRVTLDVGGQVSGSTPSACWNKIYKMIDKIQNKSNGFHPERNVHRKPGSYMFGFSMKMVLRLIQEAFGRTITSESQAYGYRPVCVDWKDIDKCNVCHMDEEYENNLFLQCDKCRMMVHARCYGETEPLDGGLWLCNLCRPGAPISPPLCCLCPVVGGAMKPTTDGRWAHLTCAMWIPETCLLDITKMEPIDGLDRIHKDRWKLLCSICGVSYGACIQCSNSTCCVAYHPLCARAAGLCVELEDEDKLHLVSFEDDDLCIRLLSFCKKHRPPSGERSAADEQITQTVQNCSHYTPPPNPAGCARSEPYDFVGRRGRKEPAALAAASVKRLFVENRPYLVSGCRQNGVLGNAQSCDGHIVTSSPLSLQKVKNPQSETPASFDSKAVKYQYMRKTFRKRLAFGKSGIHGFGIFAKLPHKAGDMVIEYTGEVVRPPVADIREHCIYNSLVGAGTYMFRIDDERVIDATKAGSVAHLINHSCEPNCYSRTINVCGDEHIIIFAKRDINQWEELTYDYRFFSKAEQLACYCGSPRCRGVVNDIETDEQLAKIYVPRCDLIEWNGD